MGILSIMHFPIPRWQLVYRYIIWNVNCGLYRVAINYLVEIIITKFGVSSGLASQYNNCYIVRNYNIIMQPFRPP